MYVCVCVYVCVTVHDIIIGVYLRIIPTQLLPRVVVLQAYIVISVPWILAH